MKADLDALHNAPSSRGIKLKMEQLKRQLGTLGHEWSAPIPVEVLVVEPTPIPVVRVQTVNSGDWTRSFALDSGAVFSRASDGITMRIGNLSMKTRGIFLGRGSNTCGFIAPADLRVNIEMSQEEFRCALSGIGRIVTES